MALTLDGIQSRIAGYVDQDENTANISATDYSLRLSYINRALFEYGEVALQYGHRSLFKEYNMNVSTSTGNASIAMPSDYRRLASFPAITYDGSDTVLFPLTDPERDGQYAATDKRLWELGNPNSGYVLRVFGITLVSGASVKVPYFASPQSLASPANIAEIPNPEYLVQRGISLVLEAREDARFQIAKAEADRILSNILEAESIPNIASDEYRVKTVEETRHNFRIGED